MVHSFIDEGKRNHSTAYRAAMGIARDEAVDADATTVVGRFGNTLYEKPNRAGFPDGIPGERK